MNKIIGIETIEKVKINGINQYISIKSTNIENPLLLILHGGPGDTSLPLVRMTVPSYDSYFELIPAIGEEITAANPELKCTVPAYCFIKYLDNEYKDKDINIEFCEAVEKMGKETGDIKFSKIDSVSAVSVMHKGAYAGLAKAYAFAFKLSGNK